MNIEITNSTWVSVEDVLDENDKDFTGLGFADGNGNIITVFLTLRHLKQMLKDIQEEKGERLKK